MPAQLDRRQTWQNIQKQKNVYDKEWLIFLNCKMFSEKTFLSWKIANVPPDEWIMFVENCHLFFWLISIVKRFTNEERHYLSSKFQSVVLTLNGVIFACRSQTCEQPLLWTTDDKEWIVGDMDVQTQSTVQCLTQTSILHFHSSFVFFNWPAFSWNDFCNQLNWFLIWLQDVQLCIIVLSCSHFKWIFKGYFLNHLNKFCCISTKFLLEILGNIFTDDFAKVIFWVILSSNPPQRCLSTTQYNISPPGIPLKTKRHTYLSHQQVDFLLLNNWLKADWRMVSS